MSFAELAFEPKLAAEIASAFLGILSVALLSRGDGRGWPVGVVMVALSSWVYWLENIKGLAALNVFFFVAQLIGWRRWARGAETDMRRGSRLLTGRNRLMTVSLWLLATVSLGALLRKGDSQFVELDAFTTVGSLIGQALIVVGFAEAWLAYLAVDLVLVVLSAKAGLWFYLAMYTIYCGLAWQGWRGWTRDRREDKRIEASPLL